MRIIVVGPDDGTTQAVQETIAITMRRECPDARVKCESEMPDLERNERARQLDILSSRCENIVIKSAVATPDPVAQNAAPRPEFLVLGELAIRADQVVSLTPVPGGALRQPGDANARYYTVCCDNSKHPIYVTEDDRPHPRETSSVHVPCADFDNLRRYLRQCAIVVPALKPDPKESVAGFKAWWGEDAGTRVPSREEQQAVVNKTIAANPEPAGATEYVTDTLAARTQQQAKATIAISDLLEWQLIEQQQADDMKLVFPLDIPLTRAGLKILFKREDVCSIQLAANMLPHDAYRELLDTGPGNFGSNVDNDVKRLGDALGLPESTGL